MSPEIQDLAAKAKHIMLREGEGGVWTGEDVRPGKYIISFAVIAPTETPGPNPPLLSGKKEITIAEQAEETIDIRRDCSHDNAEM